jgi:hypothetical protein
MALLKRQDELINLINKPHEENYWRCYLEEFDTQIIEYAYRLEWGNAEIARQELFRLASIFPIEWRRTIERYRDHADVLKDEIVELENNYILEKDNVEHES